MKSIGIIRCEKNEKACPLAGCLKCLRENLQGFAAYDEPLEITGIFTCRCPGDQIAAQAKILKAKGADVIHLPTCLFSRKENGEWVLGQGLCANAAELARAAAREADIPFVLGTAHLPSDYAPLPVN